MGTLLGITRRPLLIDLKSLHWPRSFPVDIIHCVLLNIVPNLHELWGSKRFTDDIQKSVATTNLGESAIGVFSNDETTRTPFSYVINDDRV